VNIYTKDGLISELKKIRSMGWIKNAHPGNAGGVGNTLEDLLGIEENNLPIPNASEWELKTQRIETNSLNTLFHMEPSPRAMRFVPQILLPKYGWPHQEAGGRYPEHEMSFRQTICCNNCSDRGFSVVLDKTNEKVMISFNSECVSDRHAEWLESVRLRVGLSEIEPQPYWGFEDLFHKAGTKLLNCFFIQARTKRVNNEEYYHYENILMLQSFSKNKYIEAIENGNIYVDFDARTGHNHGTKFRMTQNVLPTLYEIVTAI
jgi:hypothetical protein